MFFTFGVFWGDECSLELLEGKKPRFHGEVSPKSHEQMRKIKRSDTKLKSSFEKNCRAKDIPIAKMIKHFQVHRILSLPNIRLLFFATVSFSMEKIGKY